MDLKAAARELRILFDAQAYLAHYPDVRETGMDPVEHYLLFGAAEGRQPCALFDGVWYRNRYSDVAQSGLNPLLHYIRHGGMELRDPNPRFNAAFYIDQHPEGIGNPLLYHLLHGMARDWPTEPPLAIESLLPSKIAPSSSLATTPVDIVIPVYRGYGQTVRCIESVLADADRPPGRIIVVDDCSPEQRLSTWLDRLAKRLRITLLRNTRNLGFVRSANRGIAVARRHDVVLLNSDTEVPPGWVRRLARAVYSSDDIATASPFSNNATICSYPDAPGGALPADLRPADIDAACQDAHAGRTIDLPTTVGFCMYIRRGALDGVGVFDAEAFGRGYGEEVDFCRRAAAQGWRHMLACDVFVYHEGAVSFGAAAAAAANSQLALQARHPDFDDVVRRHARLDPTGPARFALTAALLRRNGLPGIVFISHGQGGGVRRQMLDIIKHLRGKANIMLLEPTMRGVSLSVPMIAGHPVLSLGAERIDDLAAYLHSAGIQRVHIHHVMEMTGYVHALIRRMDVPFDMTVHDYFAICPQVNFLPSLDMQYCGEPETRHCNACIAAAPNNGAADIDSWRRDHAWLFHDAARVICPSADVKARLVRHGLGGSAIVVPHEPVSVATWPTASGRLQKKPAATEKLQIALLGVLAGRKGLATVAAVADTAPQDIALHLIGHPEEPLDARLAERLTVGGAYDDDDLPDLIKQLRPHVFWFPAQWPETYSYTLSAAIDAGGAIVASDLGAFHERLKGRPLTWLIPANAPPRAWLDAFAAARRALSAARPDKRSTARALVKDYYAQDYLKPLLTPQRRPARARATSAAMRVLVLPEYLDSGAASPCAHIRLLQPLHHPRVGTNCDIHVADLATALSDVPHTIVTHRHAITDPALAAQLVAHCRTNSIRLVFDLDDDLLDLPEDHPDAARMRSYVPVVRQMLDGATDVWTSTPVLAARLGRLRHKPIVLPNGLDERLWWPAPPLDRPVNGPLRLLCMGTGTHAADLGMLLPTLDRLQATFGSRIAIDIVGVTPVELPAGLNRVHPPHVATRSYPAFVNWLSTENRWHIGLAPLADTMFNRGKSAIKAMDYAALGLPTVASDIGVYGSAIDDGVNGLLVENTETAWFTALAGLLRDPRRRVQLAVEARAAFGKRFSLAAQAAKRRHILMGR